MVVKENIVEDAGRSGCARGAVIPVGLRHGTELHQSVNVRLDRAENPWLPCIKRELSAHRASGRLMGGVA